MQNSRDSSLWRSLAVAFGDGLAFGVGMKLTQAAGRQVAASARPEPVLLADRQESTRTERIERSAPPSANGVDQKVFDAIISALEARLNEHSGNVGRHLAELEARLALELRSLEQQDHTLSRQISEEIETMQQQMVGLHREFGEAVARIVAEQVASQVEARASALEASLAARIAPTVEAALEQRVAVMRREMQEAVAGMIAAQVTAQVTAEVTTQVTARSALLQHTVQSQIPAAAEMAIQSRLPAEVKARLEPIERRHREELERKDQEIAQLQQRLADTDANVLDLVMGIGQICRQAAERISGPAEKVDPPSGDTSSGRAVEAAPSESESPAPSETPAEALTDPPVPGFAQPQKPSRLWRVPMVSSFVFASAALALRHYL